MSWLEPVVLGGDVVMLEALRPGHRDDLAAASTAGNLAAL